jgi:hypothetical protein
LAPAIPRPGALDEMLRVAEMIGSDFDFVLIDLYVAYDTIYFGELSPYPTSGMVPYNDNAFDAWLGPFWHLPNL